MTHTSNAPITQPRWRRRVAGFMVFCFGWSNLQVGVEHSYRVSLELRAAHAGPGIDPAGPLAFRPQIGVSGGGAPVIAITAPNQAGLSHNQYQRFDVDAGGVILNNSQIAGNSLIGGPVTANPNLQGRPALTILNEVTHSGTPGQLNGIIEVFGSPAAVIVANPSGIFCNGCGVLNTGRFTLTTGVPNWIDANANASDFANAGQFAYDVTGGSIAVEGMGIEGTVGRLDLIGESLAIDAPLRAHYLDGSLSSITLAAGRQRFRQTDAGGVSSQPITNLGTGNLPGNLPGNNPAGYAIDATTLGAMRAGQIHILATEQGLGVNLAGPVAAFQQGIHLDSAGPVQLRQLAAAGEIQLDSDGNLSIGQDISAGGAIHINSGGSVNLIGGASAGGDLNLHSAGAIDVRGNLYSGGQVDMATPANLRLDGTLDAVDDIHLNSGALTLNAPLRGSGSLSIDASADVSLAGAISVGGNANISSGGYLAIQAPIQATNDLTLIAESTRISANVTVGHDYNVNASESITLDGASLAGHGIRLSSEQLVLNGAIQAPLVNLDSDSLTLGQDGLSIDGNLNLDLRGDFTLNGPLSVSGDARIESGGNQHYLSEVQAEGSLALLAGGNLTLDSNVQAGTQMILEAGGDLHLHGAASANAGMRLAAGGKLQAEHAIVAGALDVSAADARFAADVAAGGDMRFSVGKLQANGSLQSGGTLDIAAGGGGVEAGNVRSNLDLIIDSQGSIRMGDADAARDLQLGAQADIDSGHLIAGRNLNLDARGGTLRSGPIRAGGNIDIDAAGNINLNGGVFSAQGIALLGSGSLDVNGDTQAAYGITLRAESIALDGTLHAGGTSLLDAGAGTLGIADSAYIAGDAQISGRSIELAGIQSQAALQLHVGDGGYRNLGDSLVGGDYLARSGGTHSIAGTLVVVGNSDIEAAGDILLGGRLEAGGDYRASSGGQLNHAGDSLILGNAQLSSVGAQHLAGSIGSAGNLTLDAGNGLRIDASVHSNGAVNLAGGNGGISIGGDLASVSDVMLNADGNLEILGNARFRQGDLNSRQGAILLQGDTAANSLRLSAVQSIDLTGASVIDGNLVAQAGDIRFGQLDVGGDLSAHADANLRFLGDSRIAGQVDLSADSAIDQQADMTLAQSLNIDIAGDFLNEGRLAVAGNLDIAARNIRSNLVADGGLIASGHLHAQAGGNIALGQQGDFTAVDGIELTAVNLSHAGQMQSGGPLNFSGNSFSNSGLVAAESINLASQLSNSGTLYGARIDVSGHSHNSGRMAAVQLNLGSLFNSGQISGDSLHLGATANQGQIGGQDIAISGGLDNSGTLGASGLLQIDGGHVNNSGDLSGETVTIQAGMLSNGGRLRAAGNMQLTLADLNNNLTESRRCVAAPEICAQLPDTRPLTDDDYRWSQTPGEIAAGGNLQISAASLTNQGIVRSGGNFTASLTGAFQNQRSHNDLYTDAQYGQPAPAASSGILEVGGNLTLNAASLDNSGALRAAGDITLESLGDFSNTTPLPGLVGRISGRQIRIDADTVLNQGELLASAGQVQITSRDDIANQGDAARIEAFTDVRLVAGNEIDNSANSHIQANNLLRLAANRISNAGNLYGPAGPVTHIEILAADRFDNSGSAVAGSSLNLNADQYSNTGTVGSFGDATLTLPGIWSAAAHPLIAKGNLWLDVQGIAVAVGESWVSDAAWVGWNGTLVNRGSVSLNTASGNIDNLASGSLRRAGAPPADGAFLLLDAPAWTDEAFNWQIDGYDDVDLRAHVSIGQFNGSLTNLAADAAVGGAYVYAPSSLQQAVYWVGENAAGEVITHTGHGRSLPRLYAPGVSSIVLIGPDPGTLVADSLVLQGVDLVLPAALDTAAEADHIAQAQATQVTVQVAVAGSPVPLEADTPSPAADLAPDPLDLQPADAETPEASVGAGDTAGVSASVPPDSHLALPTPDLADPAAGVALLQAGDGERVALAWDARRSVPGSISAGDLALFLSGSFSNRGELAVERDLILHAAAGIDNFGAAIKAGGYLELAGDTLDNRSGSIQASQLMASFTGDMDNTDGLIRVSDWAEIYSGGNITATRGTFVSDGGDFLLTAAGDIHLTASNVSAQNGQAGVYAGGNITLDGLATHSEREEQQDTTTDTYAEQPAGADYAPLLISRRQVQEVSQVVEDGYQGSALAGQQVVVVTGGDLTALGSTIHGRERVDLVAGGDLTVRAATGTTHSETTRQLSQTDSPAWSDAGPSQAWQQTHEIRTTTTLHGGLIESGGDLNLEAGGDLTLTAATLQASSHARLAATGDIRLDSLTGEAGLTSERETNAGWSGLGLFNAGSSGAGSNGFGPNGKETLQQLETHQHGSQIKAGGDLAVIAGGDARLLGADLRAEGALAVVGQNVEIAALKDRLSEDRLTQAGKTRTTTLSEHESLVGGTVSGGGEVTVLALGEAGRIDLAGVHVASDTGATSLGAQGDIAIGTVTTEHHQFSETRSKKSGFLSSKKTHTIEEGWASVAEGSLIEGATVFVDSGQHLSVIGSGIVADGSVALFADGDIDILAAESQASGYDHKQVTRSGLFSGGGLSITLGKQQTTTDHHHTSTQAVQSQVGSLEGDVIIESGGRYRETGSQVTAEGDVGINAHRIEIAEAREINHDELETRYRQSGLSLSLGGPLVDFGQTATSLTQAARRTDSERMQILAITGIGLSAYNNASELGAAVDAIKSGNP